MVERLVIRAGGYLLFCVTVGLCGVGVSLLALTDRGSEDPSWMAWALAGGGLCSLWILVRAPFVGLVVYPKLVVHRTWSTSHAYARDNIAGATAVTYVGLLGRGGQLPLLSMVELRLRDGRRVQVPELAGSSRAVARRLEALGMPISG